MGKRVEPRAVGDEGLTMGMGVRGSARTATEYVCDGALGSSQQMPTRKTPRAVRHTLPAWEVAGADSWGSARETVLEMMSPDDSERAWVG